MAGPTVARDSELVGRVLDTPPIRALVADLDAARWTGRPGYPTRSLIGAALVKAIYALPTWSRTAALIADHHGLQTALGASPSVYSCYRFQAKLHRHHDLLERCIDSTVRAVARGDHLRPWDGPPTRLHPRLERASKTWKALYRGRAAVEREFGRLKHEWGLLPLRRRGLRRVELHADLTVLAKLATALATPTTTRPKGTHDGTARTRAA